MYAGHTSEAESSCVSPESQPPSEFASISHLLGSRPVSESSSRPYSRPVSEVSPIRRHSDSSWTESVKKVLRAQSLLLPPTTAEQDQESADFFCHLIHSGDLLRLVFARRCASVLRAPSSVA